MCVQSSSLYPTVPSIAKWLDSRVDPSLRHVARSWSSILSLINLSGYLPYSKSHQSASVYDTDTLLS